MEKETDTENCLISAIIPTLNEEKIIGNVLARLFEQSIPPDEIIVADGGSHDKTVAIAQGFENVRVIYIPVRGIATARNEAVKASQGDLILSLDADTILCDGWIEHVLDHFLDPKVVAVGSRTAPHNPTRLNRFFNILDNPPFCNTGLGNSTMFRKDALPWGSWYRKAGLWEIYEDCLIWKDLSKRGKVIYDNDIVAYIRVPTQAWKVIGKSASVVSFVSLSLGAYSFAKKNLMPSKSM